MNENPISLTKFREDLWGFLFVSNNMSQSGKHYDIINKKGVVFYDGTKK